MAPTNDHDGFREQASLYAAGALTDAERASFEAHASGCAECSADLRSFTATAGALALSVPQYDPPPTLRARVLAPIQEVQAGTAAAAATKSATLAPWLSAAAMLVVAVGLGAYAVSLRNRVAGLELQLRDAVIRIDASEQQTAAARRLVASLQTPVAILTAPDVKRFDLMGQPVAPQASARAFWSRARGLVLTASQLPAVPAGRTYQLWVVTARSPISAGLLTPDQTGFVTASFDTPPNIPEPVAVAVTLEAAGGVPTPMGERYLVGLAN